MPQNADKKQIYMIEQCGFTLYIRMAIRASRNDTLAEHYIEPMFAFVNGLQNVILVSVSPQKMKTKNTIFLIRRRVKVISTEATV